MSFNSELFTQVAIHIALSFSSFLPMSGVTNKEFFSGLKGNPGDDYEKTKWFSSTVVPLVFDDLKSKSQYAGLNEEKSVIMLAKKVGSNISCFVINERKWPSEEDVKAVINHSASEVLESMDYKVKSKVKKRKLP
ncbi:hypothetical protein [Aeromonas veronii]|uniref:hypothetical protein n=1 Tax=Aeromonas veronii TaxID=654 RepID=UPI0011B21FFB|nr:hypothetical protein [Aeromonas veronii]